MVSAALIERLAAYGRLIRLDRPVGTLLLLWPTLFAIWLASGGDPPAASCSCLLPERS